MKSHIKNVALGLKELSGSNNPFEICNYLNILTIFEDLGIEIYGYYQKLKSSHEVLHINNTVDEHTQRYVCAHELGHAILEPDINLSFFIDNPLQIKNKSEIKMDKFAAELLIDDDIIKKYPNMTIEQIAAAEYVPVHLIKLKFDLFF